MKTKIYFTLFAVLSFGLAFGQNPIVVTPDTIDDILYNPGMGIEEFHQGAQPTRYPPSRIFYWRTHWSELETEKGQINYELIDKVLARARSEGKRVGLRIMSVDDYGCETCIPKYVVDTAGGKIVATNGGAPYSKVFWPNYNDAYMEAIDDFMTLLGEHYDGHPDLNHIDLGFFGCWGEFNNSCIGNKDDVKMWSWDTRVLNTDIHLATFPNTPLIAMGSDYDALGKGLGWRGDCFGDEVYHMPILYPTWADNCDDCWKKGMITFEVCWNLQTQFNKGFDFAATMEQGLAWHMSSMNAKSSPIPAIWQPILDDALKRMGYRLRISCLEHPANISFAEPMKVSMEWVNDGVAPPYHEYILRMELSPVSGGESFKHDFAVDLRTWLPGAFSVSENITIPHTLATGVYNMRFALLFPDTEEPAIELGNEGKDSLGWYPLSKVNIGEL